MVSKKSFIGVLAILFCMFLYLLGPPVEAQNPFGIATNLPIVGKDIKDGYIVVAEDDQFSLSGEAYQTNMIGVINQQSAIEIRFKNEQNTFPVVTNGQAYVMVSLFNGQIKKGDYITSSPLEGIGMKATVPGQVIGIALENAESPERSTVRKIRISVESNYFMNPLFLIGPQSSLKVNVTRLFSPGSQQTLIKYVIGGGVFLLSLLFCLVYFGRLSLKGVEALGRNPLAANKIQFGIIVNVIMGIVICFVAFGASLYIIRFL